MMNTIFRDRPSASARATAAMEEINFGRRRSTALPSREAGWRRRSFRTGDDLPTASESGRWAGFVRFGGVRKRPKIRFRPVSSGLREGVGGGESSKHQASNIQSCPVKVSQGWSRLVKPLWSADGNWNANYGLHTAGCLASFRHHRF